MVNTEQTFGESYPGMIYSDLLRGAALKGPSALVISEYLQLAHYVTTFPGAMKFNLGRPRLLSFDPLQGRHACKSLASEIRRVSRTA
jgi:hypothetical protein